MKLAMSRQDKGYLLIQVTAKIEMTACRGLTVYSKPCECQTTDY